jgi:hypothetical protein
MSFTEPPTLRLANSSRWANPQQGGPLCHREVYVYVAMMMLGDTHSVLCSGNRSGLGLQRAGIGDVRCMQMHRRAKVSSLCDLL